MNQTLLWVFIPTFFLVSLTPGMCMTLALSMGMTIGVRRTLWMMWGELIGVGLVAALSVVGAAAVILKYPLGFIIFKYVGGAYLIYLGYQLWCSRGRMALGQGQSHFEKYSGWALSMQGFVTAVANPKGWAFFVALLPPFLDLQQALAPQLRVLIFLILLIEFSCLMLYASGGRTIGNLLKNRYAVQWVNRVAGILMTAVGIWLALG